MHLIARLNAMNAAAGRIASLLASLFLLATRLCVAWQFLKSGWLKLTNWETTLFLFTDEYRVPLLPPAAAAVLGTAGEIVFPLLLIFGVLGRYAAVGLSAVNVLAVVSYAHVLLAEGFEAAIAQHVLWGFMLLVLIVFGVGSLSLDRFAAGLARTGDGKVSVAA